MLLKQQNDQIVGGAGFYFKNNFTKDVLLERNNCKLILNKVCYRGTFALIPK